MANKFNVGDKVKLSATYYSNPDYYFGPDWRDVTFTVLTTTAIDSITLKRDGFEMDPKWHFSAGHFELVKDEVAPAVPEHGVGEYILIVMRNGKLAPSIAPKVYSSWAQAKAVSHQMAANNPGEQFVIFKKIAEAVGEKPITPKVELKLVA